MGASDASQSLETVSIEKEVAPGTNVPWSVAGSWRNISYAAVEWLWDLPIRESTMRALCAAQFSISAHEETQKQSIYLGTNE